MSVRQVQEVTGELRANNNNGEQMNIPKLGLMAALALGGLMAASIGNAQPPDDKGEKKGGQGGRKGPPSVEMQLERMTKELSLTDDQKPKVKEVIEENRKKMQEVFADRSAPREERREKMQKISDEQDKKFKEILKADQYAKWEKMRDKMREEMRNRRGGGPGGPGTEGEKKGNSEKKD